MAEKPSNRRRSASVLLTACRTSPHHHTPMAAFVQRFTGLPIPISLFKSKCKGCSINENLEIVGRVIKVSSVTEHVRSQEAGTATSDFDDDDGGGLVEGSMSV